MPFYTNTPAGVPWQFSASYQVGTVVLYTDDKLYAANSLIPASTPFTIGAVGATWRVVSDGAAANIPDWLTATVYSVGAYANQGNKLYKALTAHTSGVFATDLAASRWVEVSPSAGSITDWVTATLYLVNDYVNVSGTLYKCIVSHTAAALFATDLAAVRWQLIGAASTVNTITQAAHGFAAGDWVSITGGVYVKASASLATTAEVVGRVATVPTVNTFTVSGTGTYLTGLVGLTAGPYYISATVPGTITSTAPSITGTVSKPVFVADSATSGYVLILRGAITGSPLASPVIVKNIVDFTVAEPLAPAFGDVYINTGAGVGSTTVAQTFVAGRIYRWLGGPAWELTVPVDGWIAYNQTADRLFTFDGATWTTLTAAAAAVISPDTNTFAQATDGQLNFVVNGVAVGNMTESGGVGKLTWPGIIDPAAYAGTPQTIAQRDTLVAVSPLLKKGYLTYVVDTDINEYQVWDGVVWKTVGDSGLLPWEPSVLLPDLALRTGVRAGSSVLMVSNAGSRTSRPTFDATEAATWDILAQANIPTSYPPNETLSVGFKFSDGDTIWQLNSARTTGATFDATEKLQWTALTAVSLYKGSLANTAALIALAKASLVDGTLYAVGLDFFVWRPAATSGAYQPTDTVMPGLDAGWWVKVAGRYAGLYSSSAPYNQYDVVLHASELYFSNFSRDAGVWGASPTVGVGAASFTKLPGVIKPQFTTALNYSVGDLVYDSGTTLGLIPGIYRVLVAYTNGNLPNQADFELFAGRPVFYGQRAAMAYKVGDYVEEAGTIYRCIVANGLPGLLGPFVGTDWVAVGDNLYTADGTIADAVRTVTLDGNDIVFVDGVQQKVTIGTDGVSGTRVHYIPSPHTFATGVSLVPTNDFQFYVPLANATSTGNCVIDSFSGDSVNSVVMFALQNADVVSRNFVFNAAYKGFDASTALGTLTLAAGARRFVRFRMPQSGTTWTLVEDSAGFSSSAGLTDALLTAATNNVNLVAGEHNRVDGTSGVVANDTVTIPAAPAVGEYGEFYNASGADMLLAKDAGDSYLSVPSLVVPNGTGFTWRCVVANTIEVVGTGRSSNTVSFVSGIWSAAIGGYQTFVAAAGLHGMGVNPKPVVYSGTGPYIETAVDQISIATNGDVTLRIAAGDAFDGQVRF